MDNYLFSEVTMLKREWDSTGPVKPARMVFSDDGNFSFEVLLKCIRSGS